ncbi:hypothetical protein [Alloactinosynnema sp. L-07]|nr:hypothetical protein [Alloactinosynnema sp. L-07]CRK59502.1 hypothetical protein [Alloactinosynnema sp. L-07]
MRFVQSVSAVLFAGAALTALTPAASATPATPGQVVAFSHVGSFRA